jgi:hypothetical protein
MSLRTLIAAALMRNRHMQSLADQLETLSESMHRLEIDQRKLRDHFVLLDAQQEKLAGRLDGRRGGRPRADQPRSLDEIPLGDKAALRAALGVVPGNRFTHKSE